MIVILSNKIKTVEKVARNAQEESSVLNRPITIAGGCAHPTTIFVGRCPSDDGVGYFVGFQKGLWLQCSYGVDFLLKHKSLVQHDFFFFID